MFKEVTILAVGLNCGGFIVGGANGWPVCKTKIRPI